MGANACLDCERRHIGCHGKCQDYKDYKDLMEKKNEKRRKAKAEAHEFYGFRDDAHNRLKRWE